MFRLNKSLPEFEHVPPVERLCNCERPLDTMKSQDWTGSS